MPKKSEPVPEELDSTPKKPKRRPRRAARKAGAKEARAQGPWWLGPLVVYVCMLSAMLLVGLISSSLGLGSANADVQVFVDNNIVWESGPVPGGWSWYEINENVSGYTGRHNLTIRWVTTEGTVGAATFDNLCLGDNVVDNFETDPATDMNGWTYSERDTDNVMSLQRQSDHVVSGTYGWEFSASANTASGDFAQITKSFDFTGADNIHLWTWTSWDLREVADVISQITTYAVALIVVYLHVNRFERKKFWSSVGIKREGMLKSVIWVFALWVIFTVILSIYPPNSVQGFFAPSPDWYFIYLGFAFFIPVALTEELVFRGFMINRFSVKGPVKAIVLGSVLFTFLHLWYWSFGIEQALLNYSGLFLLATWWGIVYWKTRNLFGPILAHGLYNLGLVAEHFWTGGGVVLGSSVFMVGVACLGYLTFLYLKNMFIEMETLVKKKP